MNLLDKSATKRSLIIRNFLNTNTATKLLDYFPLQQDYFYGSIKDKVLLAIKNKI